MTTAILLIILGLALLYFGGELLVRGSASLALRLGLTPLVAGLTVVAFGTSCPELVASLKATLRGQGDIAAGNAIGSNSFNIGVILAITAIICPLRVGLQMLRFDAPVMLAVMCLPFWLFHDGVLSRAEAGILVTLLITYTVLIVRMARSARPAAAVKDEFTAAVPVQSGTLLRDLAFIGAGFALLIFGSGWMLDGAVTIARFCGLSDAVIGLTIVAAGTSTPELAASLIAAFRKQPDIALGNLIGSNIFNILAIFGISGLVRPISAPGLGTMDIVAMVALSAAMLPMICTGQKLSRGEGFVLLAGYGTYLWWLWPKK